MRCSQILTAILLAQLSLIVITVLAAVDPDNYFTNPPLAGATNEFTNNGIYAVGTVVDLTWVTISTNYELVLYQNHNDTYQSLARSRNLNGATTYRWKAAVDGRFDLRKENVFFFAIYTGTNKFFSCHYFNITTNQVDAFGNDIPQSSSSSSSSSSATSAPTSAATAASATSTATSAAIAQQSDSSPNLGLGVGLGLGIPLLFIVAFIFGYFVHRRKRDTAAAYAVTEGRSASHFNGWLHNRAAAGIDNMAYAPSTSITELDSKEGASSSVHELADTHEVARELPGEAKGPPSVNGAAR